MIRRSVKIVVRSLLITCTIGLGLIFTQYPKELPPGEGLVSTKTLDSEFVERQPQTSIKMRDGYGAQVRRYPSTKPDAPLSILVHGSGWHGLQFDTLAKALSASADVVVPGLRGHGYKPGMRGDIDYINQFEDDLADLITATQKPGQKVVRFVGGAHGGVLDAAVLMAPFLKYNAPTTREKSGGWAYPLTRRIIGLSMLNTFRITALNHLTIMQFRMPQVVLDGSLGHTATTSYSYRLNRGFAPRSNYLEDVVALPRFVLIAWSADEALVADQFEPTMAQVADNGTYTILEGVGHLDIVNAPQTAQIIESLLNEL